MHAPKHEHTASSLTCKKFEWRSIHKSLNRIPFGIFHEIFNQIFTEFRSVFILISFEVINGFGKFLIENLILIRIFLD